MAFLIKSDAVMTNKKNAVGNIFNYYGAQDYAAMADFARQIYVVNGVQKGFDDLFKYQRSSVGYFYSTLKKEERSLLNDPRIHSSSINQESGLLLEASITNFLNEGVDQESFVAVNSSYPVLLSWVGSGEVDIVNTSSVSLNKSFVESGRNFKFYNRTGQVSGNIQIVGQAENIVVCNSAHATPFVDYGATKSADYLEFSDEMVSLISSGDGSVVMRFALLEDDGDEVRYFDAIAYNSQSPAGGIRLDVAYRYGGQGTGIVAVHSDNASLNSSENAGRNLGNRSSVAVAGMYFEDFGQTAGVICYGQASEKTVAATPPSQIDEFHIGQLPGGVVSSSTQAGVILTHVVVYDRKMTEDEAFNASVFGFTS